MKISSVSEMRAMDQKAIAEFGIPEAILMENAGGAAYEVLKVTYGISIGRVLVICGIGNNGGDGLVLARKIHSNGGKVCVVLLGDPQKFSGAARINYEIITTLPIEVDRVETAQAFKEKITSCSLIVDAVFGTGLDRTVEGFYADVIELINQSGKAVLSVDIPSGVNGDNGDIMGVAVRADQTVTFGLPKYGNLFYPGSALCGKLFVSHISFSPVIYNVSELMVSINALDPLPPRPEDAHKGDLGEALFIAGADGYYGAPYFSAVSFLKAGGGYSRLASPKSVTPIIAAKGSEIVFVPQEETAAGSIAISNREALLKLSERMDMVVIGPGLSLDPETQKLVRELVTEIEKPLLLDGDGITAICGGADLIKNRKTETILTPHLGEMSRLTGMSVPEIKADRIRVLQKTCSDLNAIIALKGAHSLIGYPDGKVVVNMSGNPGMATAGSGDVLTGTIAAMFGLGLPMPAAVRIGVFMHGLAGDLAAARKGEDGITAQDILENLPEAVKQYRLGLSETLLEQYQGAALI